MTNRKVYKDFILLLIMRKISMELGAMTEEGVRTIYDSSRAIALDSKETKEGKVLIHRRGNATILTTLTKPEERYSVKNHYSVKCEIYGSTRSVNLTKRSIEQNWRILEAYLPSGKDLEAFTSERI